MYKESLFDLNDFGSVNLWTTRSVEYALFTHKLTGKQIDHFNTHFAHSGQDGQYQSAKEVQAAMELYHRSGAFTLIIVSVWLLSFHLNFGFYFQRSISILKISLIFLKMIFLKNIG